MFTMTSIKKHIEYFNFRSKIQLDHPVGPKVNRVIGSTIKLMPFYSSPSSARPPALL